MWLASIVIAYQFKWCDTPLPLFNADIESISWILAHAFHTALQPHKYLKFECISLQCFFSKTPTISETFLNINIESALISQIPKHFWNTSASHYRHSLSVPNVHPQIWGTIQRHVTKMPCSCFSGLDVEMLFLCFGIHPK